jgi:hypothetical protein
VFSPQANFINLNLKITLLIFSPSPHRFLHKKKAFSTVSYRSFSLSPYLAFPSPLPSDDDGFNIIRTSCYSQAPYVHLKVLLMKEKLNRKTTNAMEQEYE